MKLHIYIRIIHVCPQTRLHLEWESSNKNIHGDISYHTYIHIHICVHTCMSMCTHMYYAITTVVLHMLHVYICAYLSIIILRLQ